MKANQSKSGGRKVPAVVAKAAKPAAQAKRKPAPATAPPAQLPKPAQPPKKDKLIRDSFTLPREDFELIAALKDRALDFKRPTKKSELLRAGLQALAKLEPAALRAALEALRPLKAGRPKNKA